MTSALTRPPSVQQEYAAAITAYCATGEESDLSRAYELGRAALTQDFSLSHLLQTHQNATKSLKNRDCATRCSDFFCEVLAVYDMAIRGYRHSVERLRAEVDERKRIEQDLRQATFALAKRRDELDDAVAQRTAELDKKLAELEHVNHQLRETNQEQAEFTYSISHDLMSPLNTISSMLDILEEDLPEDTDEDTLFSLDAARLTSRRMHQIVKDILEYSQTIGGEPEFSRVDLRDVILTLLDDMKSDIKTHGVTMDVGDLPHFFGCATQLRVLFQNILSNAIKFRHTARAPMISISAHWMEQGEFLEISVSDNGIGISKEHFERIFGIFQRLHTYSEYPGTGLGLTLCKRVAANHGGHIDVYSELGVGTSFKISLRKETDEHD